MQLDAFQNFQVMNVKNGADHQVHLMHNVTWDAIPKIAVN